MDLFEKTNALTKLLKIRYPIVQGGMIWCSGAKLAAAVSESGGLGLIGSGSMDPPLLQQHILKARSLTSKPFGVNIPLLYPHAEEHISIVEKEIIPVVFTSAGNPARFTSRLKQARAIVFHVVSTPLQAQKAQQAGVDGVVAEGFEAGGHNGREELTTMVLVPQVVDRVNIPVLAAGGIGTGRQIAAALALGASGVQIGTRFALTQESSAHPVFLKACLEAGFDATHLVLKKGSPVRLLKNKLRDRLMQAEAQGATLDQLLTILQPGASRRGMFEGDLEAGELEIGQVTGMIRDLPKASEALQTLVQECNRVFRSGQQPVA